MMFDKSLEPTAGGAGRFHRVSAVVHRSHRSCKRRKFWWHAIVTISPHDCNGVVFRLPPAFLKPTTMKKSKNKITTKVALLCAKRDGVDGSCSKHPMANPAGDALVDKLEEKGILSADEAKQLREENKQDFAGSFTNNFDQAFNKVTGTPDYVTGYKFSGDFRGRYDEVASTDGNSHFTDRDRDRYRLRVGLVVTLKDNLEAGFRITSGDPATANSFNNAGNPLSNNSTLQDNGTKKNVYLDTAYGKWTALNGDGWLFSMIIGKMDNPLQFTPMVFDADWTPEGAAIQSGYTFNDQQAILVNGAAFVEDQEVGGGTQDLSGHQHFSPGRRFGMRTGPNDSARRSASVDTSSKIR